MAGTERVTSFEQVRHRPPTPLASPRELVVACAPLRSNVNLSTIVRTATQALQRTDGCRTVARHARGMRADREWGSARA